MDGSVRGGYFWWPKPGTSRGHQRGHQLAKTGYFLMATDRKREMASGPECDSDALDRMAAQVHDISLAADWLTNATE